MKKTIFIFALAMVFMLTQCKKQETVSINEQIKGVQMVLKVNNDSRTSFTDVGAISWSANDKIYVITNGQCVGSVTNGGTGGNTFTGTLSISSGTYDFDYYYVGTEQTIAGAATSFTMDFTKQDGTLANLGKFHVGHGSQTSVVVTQDETVTTQATMQTLVAMAYFNTSGMADEGEKVYLYGDNINNTLTINFSNNAVTYGKSNGGWICTGSVSTGAYVMLVPNDGSATDITFASKRTTGTCNGVFNYGISESKFYCAGGNTSNSISVTATAYQEGLLRGIFSIGYGYDKFVKFSQGNLQYIGSATTPYWKFAENQYDYIGGTTAQNSDAVNIDRDLFGWGTSGYNHGAVCYQPYHISTNNSDYYAYNSVNSNLWDDFDNKADWGYNAILNGGNTQNSGWRTMERYDWGNLTTNGGFGIVNGVRGLIVLPYNWNTDYSGLCSFTIGASSSWPNQFNASTTPTWEQMEAAGCIFLPAAGYRDGTSLNTSNSYGYYWSATRSSSDNSYGLVYYSYGTTISMKSSGFYRYRGASVRLVKYQ